MPFIGIDQLTEISDQNNKELTTMANLRIEVETRMRGAAQKGEYQVTFSVLPFSKEHCMRVRNELMEVGYGTSYDSAESYFQVTWG